MFGVQQHFFSSKNHNITTFDVCTPLSADIVHLRRLIFFLLYKGGEHARSVNYHLVFGHATKFYTVFSLATPLSPPARRSRATLAGDRLDC